MKGKNVMITGANSGIGKATAIGLAKMGANIVMVCRDREKGETAMNEIKTVSGNEEISLLIADLSSQEQIRALVKNFKEKFDQLHVLINNAGIMPSKRRESVDGYEMNFAVNYLAPFLLTNLLLDVLKRSAPSHIINVSSGLHKTAELDLSDLQSENKFSSFKVYGQSKLALILFTYELSRRLEGTGVTVNALHPGLIKTNLGRDFSFFMRNFQKLFSKKPEVGAETSIYLASSPDVETVSGKYFVNRQAVKSSDQTYDEDLAKELWNISLEMTNLT